ncbi:MAG TPA: PAS domain S-box protein, partial [Terriglobales bacterium]|nr:PAS domain S-box protein [Terriglobales bacterium]
VLARALLAKAKTAVRRCDVELRRKDGRTLWALVSVALLRNKRGHYDGALLMVSDITERKSAEVSLGHLAAIVEHSEDAIFSQTLDGIITSWNKAAELLYGYAAVEIIGRPASVLAPPERLHEVVDNLATIRSEKGINQCETLCVRKGGERFPVSLTISPIKNSGGKVAGASVIARDIGQRKRLQQQLEARYEDLKILYEISENILNIQDLPVLLGRIIVKVLSIQPFDLALVRFYDQTTDMLEAAVSRGFRSPENVQALDRKVHDPDRENVISRVITTQKAIAVEDVVHRPALVVLNKEGIHSTIYIPIRSKGEVLGVLQFATRRPYHFEPNEIGLLEAVGNQMGIAIQKARLYESTLNHLDEMIRSEARLREMHTQLEALHAVTATASRSLDLDLVLQAVSRQIAEIFQFAAIAIYVFDPRLNRLDLRSSYRARPDIFFPATTASVGGIAKQVATSDKPLIFEDIQTDPEYERLSVTQAARNAGIKFMGAFAIPVQSKSVGSLCLYDDMARKLSHPEIQLLSSMASQVGIAVANANLYKEAVERADELASTTAQLQKAGKIKDEFLAVISHELRTPLNVIMGYSAMIHEQMFGPINSEQEQAVEKITIQATELLRMITGILDVIGIEAKGVKVELLSTDLNEFLTSLEAEYRFPLNKKIRLQWNYNSDLPAIPVDREKLRHILRNLINNAVKFTEKGTVTISARYLQPDQKVEIAVADTGIGIADKDLPIIFDMFRQVDSSETRPYGGVGLGLYLVKKYTELMGGTVTVQSEPGKGSIFTVALPIMASA